MKCWNTAGPAGPILMVPEELSAEDTNDAMVKTTEVVGQSLVTLAVRRITLLMQSSLSY